MRPEDIRVEDLPARRVCVRRHDTGLADVDRTRRPMYQHMIQNELVVGASMLRFPEGLGDDAPVDVLIAAASGFEGDDVLQVEILPAGRYAVADFEGPHDRVDAAREAFVRALGGDGYDVVGRMVQVHLMDPIEGVAEQQFQARLADPGATS